HTRFSRDWSSDVCSSDLSIIKNMGGLSDIQVGFFNSIPWLISIVAMYAFAACAGRWRFQQAWVAAALLIAGLGMFLSTTGGPVRSEERRVGEEGRYRWAP